MTLCRVPVAGPVAAVAWALLSGAAVAAPAWVDATRLALRASPAAESDALQHLPANTAVEVQSRSNRWCAVRVPALGISGFVACRFLSERPLRAADFGQALDRPDLPASERLELLQKRFWVEPNWPDFEAYGRLLVETQLTPAVRRLEDTDGLNRPERAEWQAMKARLQQGWTGGRLKSSTVSPSGAVLPALSVFLPKVGVSRLDLRSYELIVGPMAGGSHGRLRLVHLIEKSRPTDELLEQWLSRFAGSRRFKASAFGAPAVPNYGGLVGGAWDVGSVHIELPGSGVPMAALGRDGVVDHVRAQAIWRSLDASDAECDQIGREVITLSKPLPEQRAGAGYLSFVFGLPRLDLIRRLSALSVEKPDSWAEQHDVDLDESLNALRFTPLSIDIFDLDGDGVADLAFVSWAADAQLSTGPQVTRNVQVFANVQGRWTLRATHAPLECAS